MRFTLSSSTLNYQLQTLSKVINSKNSLPILDCFLFEVADGELTLTTSDKENVMTATLDLDQCDGEGMFAIPNRAVLDAVKELPDQPLTFEVDLNTYALKVSYQNGFYNFVAQDGSSFPKAMPLAPDASLMVIPSATVVDFVTRSLFATAQDELRPVMNSIFFELNADGLSVVATDAHKLVRNRNFTVKSEEPTSFILPKKPAQVLKVMLGRTEDEVTIKFDSNNALFAVEGTSLTCRLVEGRYPNYNSVIPKDNPNLLTIDRKALLSALRRVLPFSSDSTHLVRLAMGNGNLEISSQDVDFAKSAKENILCDYTGRNMAIGFNGATLGEILNNLDSEEVVLMLADPSRAGVIVPAVQPENEDILTLVMPMMLND